jgi:hypothetical protein
MARGLGKVQQDLPYLPRHTDTSSEGEDDPSPLEQRSALSKLVFEPEGERSSWSMEKRISDIQQAGRGRDTGEKGTKGELEVKRAWDQFLKVSGRGYRPNLRRVNLEEGMLVVAEFVTLLVRKGLSKPLVDKAIIDLRSVLLTNGCALGGEKLTSTTTNHWLARAKKGLKRDIARHREAIEIATAKQALPIIAEMFAHLFMALWNPGDWTDRWAIDRCGSYCVLVLGSAHGLRPSNLLLGDLMTDSNGNPCRNQHYMRKEDMVWFLINLANLARPHVVRGSSSKVLRALLNLPARGFIPEEQTRPLVLELEFNAVSTKTTTTTADRGLAAGKLMRKVGRRNDEEARHLSCLFCWAINADPEDTVECFFARSSGRANCKFLLKREVVSDLRESASACGLDPRNYMAKSMRTTYVSFAAGAGIPLAETNRMAGLVPNSQMAVTTYNMGVVGLTTPLLMERATITADQLRARIMLGSDKRKGSKIKANN